MVLSPQTFIPPERKPFLEKNAVSLKGIKRLFGKASDGPGEGKFVKNIDEQVGPNAEGNIHFFTPEEAIQKRKDLSKEEGAGGMVGDFTLGTINFLTPKKWGVQDKVQNGLYQLKDFLTKVDTKAASPLAGKNPETFRGKLFSVPAGKEGHGIQIGEKINEDGSVSPITEGAGVDRRPSLLAPVQNTTKLVTPFLAASYVGSKLYPMNKEENPSTEDDGNYKVAWEEERLSFEMDKRAAVQKITMLEDEIEKYASKMESLSDEVKLLTKEASWEREQKEKLAQEFESSKGEFLEKEAEYEKFRLRTIARARSASAVKLAEDMLDNGIIKQAEFDKQVDHLLDCDEETFNLYSSLVKNARNEEEGLESLAYLMDYRGNNVKQPAVPQKGFSKRGESIGEAARSLIKY